MAAPAWSPASIYQPGDIVQPLSPLPVGPVSIDNPDFSSGTTGWDLGGTAALQASGGYTGANCIKAEGNSELQDGSVTADVASPCQAGQSITLTVMGRSVAGTAGTGFSAVLFFYDASDVPVGAPVVGPIVNRNSAGGNWAMASVTATVPSGAVKVKPGASMNVSAGPATSTILVDTFRWNHTSPAANAGLVYRAVQAAAGLSGATEPAWPTTNGVQVVDNQVTWEAVYATRVEWTAHPLLVSGAVEPTWPTGPGGMVLDNTINWTAVTQEIKDPNCPQSKVVLILASKVFAADDDIIRYCATLNALDWSSQDDAGFLPAGMQSANGNAFAVLAEYRGNLAAFNASVFQNWMADPDPAAMSMLDQMQGNGSVWHKAATPVGNDLVYLSAKGVRSIGIAGASENLQSNDIGVPIDPLVKQAMKRASENLSDVLGFYSPGMGQYMLTFADFPPPGMYIFGSFANWDSLDDYSGAVSFGNQVGDCIVVWTGGDELPTGATLTVNNLTSQVILTIPLESADEIDDALTFTFMVIDSVERTAVATRTVNLILPALSITGTLPAWIRTLPYSASLTINNNIGDCSIVSIGGDTLPAGASITIDNVTDRILVAWDADAIFPTGDLSIIIEIEDSEERSATWSGPVSVRGSARVFYRQFSGGQAHGILSYTDNGINEAGTVDTGLPSRNVTVVAAGGRLYAKDGDALELMTSGDGGMTWEPVVGIEVIAGLPAMPMAYDDVNEVWLSQYKVNTVGRSVDGVNFTDVVVTGVAQNIGARPLACLGGVAIAFSFNSSYYRSIDGGQTWAGPYSLPTFSFNNVDVAAYPFGFVVCRNGDTPVAFSVDGADGSWVERVSGLTGNTSAQSVYGDGILVLIGPENTRYSTDDGATFMPGPTGNSGISAAYSAPLFDAARFLVSMGANGIFRSNGISGSWELTLDAPGDSGHNSLASPDLY